MLSNTPKRLELRISFLSRLTRRLLAFNFILVDKLHKVNHNRTMKYVTTEQFIKDRGLRQMQLAIALRCCKSTISKWVSRGVEICYKDGFLYIKYPNGDTKYREVEL